MALVFRSSSSQFNASIGITVTVTKPAGTAAGDLLVCTQACHGLGGAALNAPSGWTEVGTTLGQNNGGSNQYTSAIWYKVAGASEPTSYSFSDSNGGGFETAVILAFSGSNATPLDTEVQVNKIGFQSTYSVTGVTTSGAAELLLYFAAECGGETMSSPPSGYTTGYEGSYQHVYYTTKAAAGATGTVSGTFAVAPNCGSVNLVAFKPSSSGGTHVTHSVTPVSAGTRGHVTRGAAASAAGLKQHKLHTASSLKGAVFVPATHHTHTVAAPTVGLFGTYAQSKVIIPAYFSGGSSDTHFTTLINNASKIDTAIVNVNSGPGTSLDTGWQTTFNNLRAAGIKILGYVDAQFGAATLASAEAQIDNWYTWYNPDGLFFDNATTDAGTESYFHSLYTYVKAKSGVHGTTVCINCAAIPDVSYAQTATVAFDIAVTFEDTLANMLLYGFVPEVWQQSLSPYNFCQLITGASTEAQMYQAVELARSNQAGYLMVYDTSSGMYQTLPADPYWTDEINAIHAHPHTVTAAAACIKAPTTQFTALPKIFWSAGAANTLPNSNTLQLRTSGAGYHAAALGIAVGATGWAEVFAQGGTPTPAGSIGSQSGRGWLLDSNLLEGQALPAGNWTGTFQLFTSNLLTLTLTFRLSIYHSNGTYTTIGSMVSASTTPPNHTYTTVALPATAFPRANFAAGDKLYLDVWADVTANTLTTSDTIYVQTGQFSNAGQYQDYVTTPGLSPTHVTHLSAPVSANIATGHVYHTASGITTRLRVHTSHVVSSSASPSAPLKQHVPHPLSVTPQVGIFSGSSASHQVFGVSAALKQHNRHPLATAPHVSLALTAAGPHSVSVSAALKQHKRHVVLAASASITTLAAGSVAGLGVPRPSTTRSGGDAQSIATFKQQMAYVYKPDGTTFIDVWRDAPLLSGFKEAINAVTSPIDVRLPRKFDNFDETGAPNALGSIAQGNVVKFYLFGPGLPTAGLLRYQGFIDAYAPTIAENGEESVTVTLVPPGAVAGDNQLIIPQAFGTPNVSASYQDPVTIAQWFFNNNDPVTSKSYVYPLTWNASNASSSSTSAQYTFQNQSILSCFQKLIQLLPSNWFFRFNVDGTVTLAQAPATSQHTFIVAQHLAIPTYKKDWTQLRNVAYVIGNNRLNLTLTTALASGTVYTTLAVAPVKIPLAAGTVLQLGGSSGSTTQQVTLASNSAWGATSLSVSSFTANAIYAVNTQVTVFITATIHGSDLSTFGPRKVTLVDNRINDLATANSICTYLINQFDQMLLRTTIRVLDYRGDSQTGLGYDIESIKVGDTCNIANLSVANQGYEQPSSGALWGQAQWDQAQWDGSGGGGNSVLSTIAIIVSITYNFDYVDLELGYFNPNQDRVMLGIQQSLIDYTTS